NHIDPFSSHEIQPPLFFIRAFLCGLLFRASPTEHVGHRVISLMTGIFKKRISGFLRYGKSDFPGPGVGLRIVNGDFVVHRIPGDTSEPFDQPKSVAGWSATAVKPDAGRIRKDIRGLDDERIAYPMATRVSHVGADVFTGMRT